MHAATIKREPVRVGPPTAGYVFFRDLIRTAKKVGRKSDWHLIAEFRGQPRRAYYYRARLTTSLGTSGYQFTASIKDGVGSLYCRKAVSP